MRTNAFRHFALCSWQKAGVACGGKKLRGALPTGLTHVFALLGKKHSFFKENKPHVLSRAKTRG